MKTQDTFPFSGGVTRQAAPLRAPPGISDALNVDFSALRGASTRAPSKHVAKLTTGAMVRANPIAEHIWTHRSGNRYGLLVQGGTTPNAFNAETGAALTMALDAGTPNYNYLGGNTDADYLRFLDAGDYVFVLNTGAEPAILITSTPPKISGVTAGQVLGGVFVTRANYDKTYTVAVSLSSAVTISVTVTTWPPGGGAGIVPNTQSIATSLAALLTADATLFAAGISAVSLGSTIKIIYTAAPTATSVVGVRVTDGDGNNSMNAIFDRVDLISDLPLVFQHGYRVRVSGAGREDGDDYFVQFVANDPTNAPFGVGYWEESCYYDTFTTLDPTTMPHAFVRNTAGTGFTFTQINWTARLVGSDITNPFPSFIEGLNGALPTFAAQRGVPILDLTYIQNRLGMVTGNSVVLSEVDQPFNLMRTSVRQVAPSDPIDVSMPGPSAVRFMGAVAHNEVLLLLGERGAHSLYSDGPLSPATVQLSAAASVETDVDESCRPVSNGRSVFLPKRKGVYGGLSELVRIGDSPLFEVSDVTGALPDFFRHPKKLTTDRSSDAVYLCDASDSTKVYVHRFLWAGGEKRLSSWSAYQFSQELLAATVIGSKMYLISDQTDGYYLSHLDTSLDESDSGLDYRVFLDRRVASGSFVSVTYDATTEQTTFTFPYQIEAGDVLQIVATDGTAFTTASQSTGPGAAAFCKVRGDKTAATVYGGLVLPSWFEIGRPLSRNAEGYAPLDPPATLLYGTVQHDRSGPFQVLVTMDDGRTFQSVAAPRLGGPGSDVGEIVLITGGFRFGVGAKENECSVRFKSAGAIPFVLQGVSWTPRRFGRGRAAN